MGLDSWVNANRDAFESAEVFARPPLKSRQFLAGSSVVALSTIAEMVMIIRVFDRVHWIAVVCMLLVPLTVLATWARVLVVHTRLHELYIASTPQISSPGSQLDLALRAASSLSYFGVLGASGAGLAGLFALTIQLMKARLIVPL
jgi:hypothetical protein